MTICTLSDQERAALVCDAVKVCKHKFGRWFTDQGPMPVYLPRVVYLHPGRETRICKACGWRENRIMSRAQNVGAKLIFCTANMSNFEIGT